MLVKIQYCVLSIYSGSFPNEMLYAQDNVI
jgi:hypothetical protein